MYQTTVDYPNEWSNGHHFMLDAKVLVAVRWEQMEALRWSVGWTARGVWEVKPVLNTSPSSADRHLTQETKITVGLL